MLETLNPHEMAAEGFEPYREFVRSNLQDLPVSELVDANGVLRISKPTLYRHRNDLGMKFTQVNGISHLSKGQIRVLWHYKWVSPEAAILFARELEAKLGIQLIDLPKQPPDHALASLAIAPTPEPAPTGIELLPDLMHAIAAMMQAKNPVDPLHPQRYLQESAENGWRLSGKQVAQILGFRAFCATEAEYYGFRISRCEIPGRRRVEYLVSKLSQLPHPQGDGA